MRKFLVAPAIGVSTFFLLVLAVTRSSGSYQATAMPPESAQLCGSITSHSSLTATTPITIHLPLVSSNCATMLLDDFGDTSSGWPDEEDCTYQTGVYRILPSNTFLFHGASPDWGIPSDAIIRTEAWSDSDQGALGLVFGIKEFCWESDIHWESWYAFVIEPASQTYWLEYWSAFGADHVTVKYGMSPAIIADVGTHQSLEVRRSGDETQLIVNGVEVDTYTAEPFTDKRSAGVGIMTTFPTMHPMPTGFFDNFQVSASGCITLPSALCD